MNHFYRCTDCLTVCAMVEKIEKHDEKYNLISPQCGICGGKMNYMGEVNNGKLLKYHSETPCDGRCTHAVGPDCECSCGGLNHGSGIIVKVIDVQGNVPVLKIKHNEKALLIATEYRVALVNAKAKMQALPYYETFRIGSWISDKAAWWKIEEMRRRIGEAKKAKTHKSRMAKLVSIIYPDNFVERENEKAI